MSTYKSQMSGLTANSRPPLSRGGGAATQSQMKVGCGEVRDR